MTSGVAESREFDVRASDGRTLHAYEGGDPAGLLVIAHHGTPTSGMLARSWHEDAARQGVRLVGFDRAGYGLSGRHPGRSVADVAADAATIADALGVGRFGVWGASGGGPHALACAAVLGDRVVAAASLAGVAPYDAEGLDWTGGMGQDNLEEYSAVEAGEATLRPFLEAHRESMLQASPDQLAEVLSSLMCDRDREVMSGEMAEHLHAGIAHALQSGVDGWFDDDIAHSSRWGFAVEDIAVPVLIMHGEQDMFVPFAHGQWLAGHIPAAESHLTPDDGHISMTHQIGRVHRWLLEHA